MSILDHALPMSDEERLDILRNIFERALARHEASDFEPDGWQDCALQDAVTAARTDYLEEVEAQAHGTGPYLPEDFEFDDIPY